MWPPIPPAWLLPWSIWRFRNGTPAERPAGTPTTIPPYGHGFLKWAAWRRKGSPPPRPTSTAKAPIPDRIPQPYWAVLKQLNIAVPIAPPPPPPPPPNPVPANSWRLPGVLVFTSWGWRNDWRTEDDQHAIMRKFVEAGVGTVALQIGMFPPEIPSRIRSYGCKVALWGSPNAGDAQALDEADADGYLPQIEGPYEYAHTITNLEVGVGAGLSISTVTTLAGLETFIRRPDGTPDGASTTAEVEELNALGCTHAWVECYTGDMVPRDVSDLLWSAGHRGFYHANPVPGLAGRENVYVSTYQPDIDPYGRQVGFYLAEPMRPIDWQAVRDL